MLSLLGWVFGLAAAVCATVVTAAVNEPNLHIAACGIVTLAIVVVAIWDHQRLRNAGAPTLAIASSTARYLGLVWAWGALAVLAIYTAVLGKTWPEWWQFFLGFAFAAAFSLAFSMLLDRDRAAGRSDPVLIKAGRILVQVQIVGMAVGIASLFIDHKFPHDVTHADWAGNNILFFGALAIAAISLDALRSPAHM
ncbi:hypothetical protein [Hyphomicrobium sp.]|jgi:hypothetical protein|uniref:hypothetical protein n=1 Tax=Hyphomicrobium sp. TaxID=82 RepID=UPI002C5CE773|nr:hypothetical protein [Hyphomicrobium sp.]HVZ05885.1 hypothetical protein [Hyphomicrobium sp.]